MPSLLMVFTCTGWRTRKWENRTIELKNGQDEKVLTQVEPPRELRSRFSNPYFVSFGLGQKLTAAKTTQWKCQIITCTRHGDESSVNIWLLVLCDFVLSKQLKTWRGCSHTMHTGSQSLQPRKIPKGCESMAVKATATRKPNFQKHNADTMATSAAFASLCYRMNSTFLR